MAVKKNYKVILKKLKKQVSVLERKEQKARKQLTLALNKMRKLARTYQSSLAAKMRTMKIKLKAAEASSYARAAVHFERQMLKGIEAKSRALDSVLQRIEKKQAAKFKKSLTKKSQVSRKSKKSR